MSLQVISLSYSTVKDFISCPEKVFLSKIDKKTPKGLSANALMGSCIHAAAEAWYRSLLLGHTITAAALYRVFKIRWEQAEQGEIIYTAKDRDEIFTKAFDLLDLLVQSEQPYQILSIERNVSFQVTDGPNGLKIVGKPDLICRDRNGNLTIIDLKTSARSYNDDDVRAATLQCYTYLMAQKEPAKIVLKLFLKTKEPRIIDIALNPDDVSYSEWRDQFIQVKRALEEKIRYKVRSFKCSTCQFAVYCNAPEQAAEDQDSPIRSAA
jgi:CRISPR/Cas system-associated exonuclease Cas4 (RecB family)